MLQQENLAANFYGLLASQGYNESANEFKLLGQERDGSIVTSWITKKSPDNAEQTVIGFYNCRDKRLEIIKEFPARCNVTQASINVSKTQLLYVLKNHIQTDNCESDNANLMVYKPFLCSISQKNCEIDEEIELLEVDRTKQIFLQFLWPKQPKNRDQDKFLLMIHEEGIQLHTIKRKSDGNVDKSTMKRDTIVKSFVWCQWEAKTQSLFYIHIRLTTRISLEKEEDDKILSPTLSAFQFHDDLPTETVINIPLNLPKIPSSSKAPEYEDDTIPLRIHDSSHNLMIVADDDKGMLFICHYYLYQPMRQHDEDNSSSVKEVHFAYSVTLVHSSIAVHCIIPGVPWEKARHIKPTFAIVDDRLLVFQAGLFLNLLDIGLDHEPSGHIICQPLPRHSEVTHLVPCFDFIAFDSATLDLHSLQIPKNHLIDTFKNDSSFDNRLSIIQHLLGHQNDLDALMDLLNIIMNDPLDLDTVNLFKEALVAGTYSTLKKGLSQDALALIKYLPLTTINTSKPSQAKIGSITVGLSMESLHNTAMMLLSPQQRLNPFRYDIWTRLYDRLNNTIDSKKRFTSEQVSEKLIYSLACYQPEALSRCTTPQTPSTTGQMSFGELSSISTVNVSSRKNPNDVLPFVEFETCTASKQEHVISVNLRELSMHLVKNSVKQTTGFRWLKDYEPTAPTFVHAVSTRYVSAQLEISRLLCVFVCRACGVDGRVENERGFKLIDKLHKPQRFLLFLLLERYVLAVDSMAFPLPQGFSSFFTYLGYKSLDHEQFLEHAEQHVFELQIDVMKVIMNDIPDDHTGVNRKLALLSLLPRSRARRLLNHWDHPISLRIRGQEHAANVLSGNSGRSASISGGSHHTSLVCMFKDPMIMITIDEMLLLKNEWKSPRRTNSEPIPQLCQEKTEGKFDISCDISDISSCQKNFETEKKRLKVNISLACIISLIILILPIVTFIIYGKSSENNVENLAPLNSLLELFTAKASLNEIDFNLLIESTQVSLNYQE